MSSAENPNSPFNLAVAWAKNKPTEQLAAPSNTVTYSIIGVIALVLVGVIIMSVTSTSAAAPVVTPTPVVNATGASQAAPAPIVQIVPAIPRV